jgi:uncharacterized membrane protein (UPF0182 family)
MSTVRIPTRQRRWPVIVIGALVALAVLFTVMSTFVVDLLWYREVALTGVFWTELRTKVVLGAVFGLLFFALLFANLLVARRIAPPPLPFTTPEQEAVERVRMAFEPYLGWLLPLAAGLLAMLVGIGVSRQWQVFLLWRHSSGIEFGTVEPLFQRDPAFYVFSLPWLKFLQGWLFSSFVGVTFLTAIAHFFLGGIRPQARTWADRVTPPTRAHLSVLLGLIMLIKAWGYYLGRFDLLTSPRGVVQGASYTDVNAQLPALNFLNIAAVICAVLFFANIVRQRWALPIIAVIVLGAVSVLLGTAYPAFVQRFRVAPQEFQREAPYIRDNIEGTTTAFDIAPEDVEAPPEQTYDATVTTEDLEANETTISNIRLWRPLILAENFLSLQRIRSYYEFHDVDVDRYELDGERRVLMVSGREVSQIGIPTEARTWQNEHLVYTHGFGAVAAKVNRANTEGSPILELADIPVRSIGGPELTEPRIYFGEGGVGDAPFVITNSGTPELDYEGAPPGYEYTGTGGIEIGNPLQRALFAWRFRDVNLLISGQVTSSSRIMMYRDLGSRVPKPVPFLTFDDDPFLTIENGRLVWIWDAYTSTNEYPYSESVNLAEATESALPSRLVNYMRNSVKVTVDAYDGTMTYYADLSDPIVAVWDRVYPGLFTDIDTASDELRSHFRYPENLFQVQATQFATYHVTDPEVFYQNQDRWEIASDPTRQPLTAEGTTTATSFQDAPNLRPYYLLMRAPGENQEIFQLVLPFVREGRQNMVAWLAASSDPETYGRLLSLELPTEENVPGPSIVFSRLNQDPQFSQERTLLGQGGSSVLFGDLLVIPIENSFLYVQPVYVQANQSTAVPELKRVVVVNGDAVGVGQDLAEALAAAVEGVEPDGDQPGGDGGGDGDVVPTVAELLAEASDRFAAADAALRAGDLATYQREIAAAQDLVAQALELSGVTPEGGGGGNASPSASPTP